jgi:hypothetical protein
MLQPAAATATDDDASLATDGTSSKLPFAAECMTTDNKLRMVRVLPAVERAAELASIHVRAGVAGILQLPPDQSA